MVMSGERREVEHQCEVEMDIAPAEGQYIALSDLNEISEPASYRVNRIWHYIAAHNGKTDYKGVYIEVQQDGSVIPPY